MEKKFKRGKDKQIAGVCSGIAEYFDLDVTLVRVICLILCLFCYPALFIYIILAIFSLEEDNDNNDDNYEERIDEDNEYEDYSEEDELVSTTTINNSFEKSKRSNSNNPFEM